MSARTYVGFGFGPIQSGLFVYEALRSGGFGRIVVSEIDRGVVAAVRKDGGYFMLNVAGKDGIARYRLGPVELFDPNDEGDRAELVEAIGDAGELGTALPGVSLFDKGGKASVASLLAEGLSRDPHRPRVVYCAENHNHAAELLEEAVLKAAGGEAVPRTQYLNTVIGKMSGTVTDPDERQRLGLASFAVGIANAVLVEEFNRILITRIRLPGFERGIAAFEEKDDLLPFEEAKLYGHNAAHCLMGYLCWAKGYAYMSDAAGDPGLIASVRNAFMHECGAGLIHKYRGLDPLFTEEGFARYAEDLLERMVCPWLADSVARVIRDPVRKLGWNDRIAGAMRLALQAGKKPEMLGRGAALAMLYRSMEEWKASGASQQEIERVAASIAAPRASRDAAASAANPAGE